MANTRQSDKEEGKTLRVPFGARRSKLQLSESDMQKFKEEGWVLHWFNDIDGRVERALAGGYIFVKPDEARSLGDGALGQKNTDLHDRVSKIVSRGDPIIRAYLMKIQEIYYQEDQHTKEKHNQKVDSALATGEIGGAGLENKYGSGVTYSK